jgi:glycosyltransferase involved in cell wall biosynthesis
MAKLVLMLRIKDGIFFLKEWLERYESLVDEIVVLDNGSTDGTVEMLEAHPKVVDIVHTVGYNEGRDKNIMYDHVRMRNPDWCLWLDVDEIFEPSLTRSVLDKMMRSKLVDRYAFRRFHFIDRENFAASNYWLNYSAGHDRILWREKPSGYFANLLIDSPNVKGINGLKAYTNFRIKHMGYINKALVDKKAEIYKNVLTGDQGIIDTMYLSGEKSMKWIDDKKNVKVILLNMKLDALLLKQLYFKAIGLLTKFFNSLFKKSAGVNIVT